MVTRPLGYLLYSWILLNFTLATSLIWINAMIIISYLNTNYFALNRISLENYGEELQLRTATTAKSAEILFYIENVSKSTTFPPKKMLCKGVRITLSRVKVNKIPKNMLSIINLGYYPLQLTFKVASVLRKKSNIFFQRKIKIKLCFLSVSILPIFSWFNIFWFRMRFRQVIMK